MRERPILFSGPMVKAILDGRKTQTRRVVKPQLGISRLDGLGKSCFTPEGKLSLRGLDETGRFGEWFVKCPYGVPGDRLWVRETFAKCTGCNGGNGVIYRADDTPSAHPWRPSIFMPRKWSRLTLEIAEVRVERLQEISENDAIAEGCESDIGNKDPKATFLSTAVHKYEKLWDSINGKTHPWESNPWVWVLTFKRVNP